MPRLRQVPRSSDNPPIVQRMYDFLFGDRDPVREPGTATGTRGDWWTVFALVPDVLEHAVAGFALGDSNYPITPKLTLTNNSTMTLPGGTEFQFDVPTAIPATVTDQSGFGLAVISNGSNPSGNNVGGLKSDFHRASFQSIERDLAAVLRQR